MRPAARTAQARGLRLLAVTVVLVAAAGLLPQVAAAFSSVTSNTSGTLSAAASYGVTQLGGTAGCISYDGTGGACTTGTGLTGAYSVAVSPDGKTVYTTGQSDNAISVFSRNSGTGALTQLAGTNGCVSATGTGGACATDAAISDPGRIVVSSDNKHVYAQIDNGIVAFSRNTGTGVITKLAGTNGCITNTGNSGACTTGKAVGAWGGQGMAISQDGNHLYVLGNDGGSSAHIAAFSRNSGTGVLTQLAGTNACVSNDGYADGVSGRCAVGHGMDNMGIEGIAVTPDNTGLYVSGWNTNVVVAFSRNTGTGVITELAGTAGCISGDGSGGVCTTGHDLSGANDVAISPDSTSVYIASPGSTAIDVFSRNTGTNALTQLAGTAGCISEGGNSGACVSGKGLTFEEGLYVSPDGQDLYSVGWPIAVLRRNGTTGALSQSSGLDGCYTGDGSDNGTAGVCTVGTGLSGAQTAAVSPDGADLYVIDRDTQALLIFNRTR
jgi:sugar lactone lactonase YvrE